MFCRLILVILIFLGAGEFTRAEEVMTPIVDTNEVKEPFPSSGSVLDQCKWTCNRIAGNYRASGIFEANCKSALVKNESVNTLYGQAQNLASILDKALLKCLPEATYKAAKSIPEFVMAVPALTYQVAASIFSSSDQVDANKRADTCFQSLDCRKSMMRQLILFREQNPDGSFKVSDDVMLKQMADVDVDTLLSQGRVQYNMTRDECSMFMYDVRMEELQRAGEMTAQVQRRVYNRVARERTFCLGALQLLPPEIDPRSPFNQLPPKPQPQATDTGALIDRLSLVQKLGVANACLGDKFFDDLVREMCSDIVSAVIPIPVPGSKARVLTGVADEVKLGESATKTTLKASGEVAAVATDAAKSALVSGYKGLVFSTKAENNRFIDIAIKANNNLLNRARTRFLSVENTMMKFLNSAIPKEMVTALTNFHKEKLTEAIAAVKAKYEKLYPGIQIDVYSDFKSIQVAIQSPVNITPAMNQQIYADLNAAFGQANKALADKMAEAGVDMAALKAKAVASGVDPKVAGDPNMWFRGAMGATPDETNLAARMARSGSAENVLLDFSSPAVSGKADEALVAVENKRVALTESDNLTQLMAANERGQMLPRAEVFDLARKSKSAEDLAAAINLRYGTNKNFKPITAAEAAKLRDYVHDVNEFNPAIFIPEREVLSLDSATQGAASADFLGLGSENYFATASGLAGRTKVTDALRAVRAQEVTVTQSFLQRQTRFKDIVGGTTKCSGDDCLKILEKPLSAAEKSRLMDQIATDPQARRVRVSFIGQGVAQEHRIMLATHGEEIEKSLRTALEGKLPYGKLSQLTFGLDMTSSQLNQGFVNLMIGKSRTLRLTAQEQEVIQSAFESAVGKYNQGFGQYVAGDVTANVTGVRLIPGPSLILSTDNAGEE